MPNKALALAMDFFSGTHIRAVLSKMGISIEIDNQREKPSQRILKVLERLEKLSEKTNQKLVLFFDEFQCIGEIADDQSMESVLRQVAQLTQSISFVFSGSNRHLLSQLFEDRKRPSHNLKSFDGRIGSSHRLKTSYRIDEALEFAMIGFQLIISILDL